MKNLNLVFQSLLVISSLALFSCAGTGVKERQGVPPQSSASDMPWSTPSAGEGQGLLGQALQGR